VIRAFPRRIHPGHPAFTAASERSPPAHDKEPPHEPAPLQPAVDPRTRTQGSSDRPDHGPLLLFAAVALGVGGLLLTMSTLIAPGAPFILAAVLGGLALPALVLTHREAGASGVRALLRDCVRMPSSSWWLPTAGFGLPVLAWTTAAGLGGAQPLTWSLLGYFVGDLLVGAIVINIWEEMAWTGFMQRRAMVRWGATGGSLLTAVFFTGIHVPLAFDGAHSAGRWPPTSSSSPASPPASACSSGALTPGPVEAC